MSTVTTEPPTDNEISLGLTAEELSRLAPGRLGVFEGAYTPAHLDAALERMLDRELPGTPAAVVTGESPACDVCGHHPMTLADGCWRCARCGNAMGACPDRMLADAIAGLAGPFTVLPHDDGTASVIRGPRLVDDFPDLNTAGRAARALNGMAGPATLGGLSRVDYLAALVEAEDDEDPAAEPDPVEKRNAEDAAGDRMACADPDGMG